jgi:adenylate kinase family enzyme
MNIRVNVVGASGSGTTSIGRLLASELDCGHFEADDYLWLPTDPPYKEKREESEKYSMAFEELSNNESFVLSGSIAGWDNRIERMLTHVVYLDVPTEARLERITTREVERFGKIDKEFYNWAAQYDEGKLPGRSRERHRVWLESLSCPVLRLCGEMRVEESVALIIGKIA